MKNLLVTALFSLLLIGSRFAHADEFSFSFSTDPVGCTYTGSCSISTVGSGIFTTGAPQVSSDYGVSFPVNPVLAITGQFDGSAMALATPVGSVAGALVVGGSPGAPTVGIFSGIPIVFTAGGETWGLFSTDQVGPPGTQTFVEQYINGVWVPQIDPVSVTIVTVPEPAAIGMSLMALMAVLIAVRFKEKLSSQQRN